MHTSHCIGSIFSLNNWFAVRVKPASQFPLQLFGDKLRLSIVMVPRVVAVTKNHITKFDLEKEERIRDKKKMQKGGLTNYALSSYPS